MTAAREDDELEALERRAGQSAREQGFGDQAVQEIVRRVLYGAGRRDGYAELADAPASEGERSVGPIEHQLKRIANQLQVANLLGLEKYQDNHADTDELSGSPLDVAVRLRILVEEKLDG